MRATIIILSILLASCATQRPAGYARTFKQACVLMDEGSWSGAEDLWSTLLKVDPENRNINYKIGECYFMQGMDSTAVSHLKKACSGKFSRSYDKYDYVERRASIEAKLLLAKAYARDGLLSSAKREIDDLSEMLPDKHRAKSEARMEMSRVNTAMELMSEGSGIDVSALPWHGVFAPAPLIDGSLMYVGVSTPGGTVTSVSERQADGSWSSPTPVQGSFYGEYPGHVRPDGTSFWTIRDKTVYLHKESRSIEPYDAWRMAEHEGVKYISIRGDVFFSSDGSGWLPFWNTKWDDAVAGISIDGRTLYVSSDRPGSMGMHDIFAVDVRTGEAVNMGYPVNSTRDDVWFSPSGSGIAYMSSDRGGAFRVYRCAGMEPANKKVIRGYVGVVGKRKAVRITSAGYEMDSPDGAFIYIADPCETVILEYRVDGRLAGKDTISAPCQDGYDEAMFETYLMPYTPPPMQPREAILAASEQKGIVPSKSKLPPPPEENMPAWFTDTEYNPEIPVQFQFSDTLGVAVFNRYFTYGGQEFSAAELRFAEFVAAVAAMSNAGFVEISIEASASKVPSRRFASNEELARNRASNAERQITDALSQLGYEEGLDYSIVSVKSFVSGKPYRNDAKSAKETYERYQYVTIRASRK